MVAVKASQGKDQPFGLVVSGEAGEYVEALNKIVGPELLETYNVRRDRELLELVRQGVPDAVVLDDDAVEADTLKLLRAIRRLDAALPVVLVTVRTDRRWLEDALRLAAFSVVVKPLRLEELLVQIHRIMVRLDFLLRQRWR
ncbi:MAG: hypothetical protein B1H04_06010 [Planctomycetales bacterium 4484_123]|nr:MAG: hypothetical protein B1H04_06010 [Planctomycetales bacterium 4484_123]